MSFPTRITKRTSQRTSSRRTRSSTHTNILRPRHGDQRARTPPAMIAVAHDSVTGKTIILAFKKMPSYAKIDLIFEALRSWIMHKRAEIEPDLNTDVVAVGSADGITSA